MKITNTSKANQGVWTTEGLVHLKPNETRDLDVAEGYVERVQKLPFLTVGGDKAETEGDDGLKAIHRGGGSYSIMRGEEEVAEKLTKAEAAEFNAMSDEDKAAFVAKPDA